MEADNNAQVKEDLSGKFKMPYNFYGRVLELEKEIEKQKENTPEVILKGLMALYSEAIEYFGFIDQVDRCGELQMRMQSILVKPYVLKCLERYEKEHLEEDKKQPKKIIELEATKRRMSELNQQMMKEKKMKALQKENGKG